MANPDFVGRWPRPIERPRRACACEHGTCARCLRKAIEQERIEQLRRELDAAIDLAAECAIAGCDDGEQAARAKAADLVAELEALGVDPSKDGAR